jgi:hypothetical protein
MNTEDMTPTWPNQLREARRILKERGREALNNPHAMIGRQCGCGSCFTCAALYVVQEHDHAETRKIATVPPWAPARTFAAVQKSGGDWDIIEDQTGQPIAYMHMDASKEDALMFAQAANHYHALLGALEQALAALPDAWFAEKSGVPRELVERLNNVLTHAKR